MFKRLICFIIILILVGCEPVLLPAPTPTQEANYSTPVPNWGVECLPGGVVPSNQNPCFSVRPDGSLYGDDMEFIIIPNGRHRDADGNDYVTSVLYDDGFVFPLAGVNGEGYAGYIAIEIHGIELTAGQCYAANLIGGLNLDDMNPAEFEDVSAQAWILEDDGSPPIRLNVHSVIHYVGGVGSVDESPDWFWTFWSPEDVTVILRMGVDQVHANARMGNYFRPTAAFVRPVYDPGLCPGAGI